MQGIPMPRVPPEGFEPSHLAPEASALSPELWGLSTAERLPARNRGCDMRAAPDRPIMITLGKMPRKAVTSPSVTQGLGRVLVVDDDEVIRQLIAVNLQLEGFEVATAVDGQDCLDNVQSIAPDVITLDVMMPRLDGWETAVQLRKSPDTAHIKVVLITARAQEDDIARGTNVGADAYLTKPFDPGEMIRVVRELAGAPPA
jgi:CheY-like chemotaxis protein